VFSYRLRIDLAHTEPAAWRRVDLASDLYLDEVHEVIQVAFGWPDSHLHQFGSGPACYSPETEYYLCPYTEEPGAGIPEEYVRLDEASCSHRPQSPPGRRRNSGESRSRTRRPTSQSPKDRV
jgi:hypothetical protein